MFPLFSVLSHICPSSFVVHVWRGGLLQLCLHFRGGCVWNTGWTGWPLFEQHWICIWKGGLQSSSEDKEDIPLPPLSPPTDVAWGIWSRCSIYTGLCFFLFFFLSSPPDLTSTHTHKPDMFLLSYVGWNKHTLNPIPLNSLLNSAIST